MWWGAKRVWSFVKGLLIVAAMTNSTRSWQCSKSTGKSSMVMDFMNGFVSIKRQLLKKQCSNPSERLYALLPLMRTKQPTSSSKIKTKSMASFLSLLKSWNRSLMTRRRRSKKQLSSGENTTLNLNTSNLKSLSVGGTKWRLSSGGH